MTEGIPPLWSLAQHCSAPPGAVAVHLTLASAVLEHPAHRHHLSVMEKARPARPDAAAAPVAALGPSIPVCHTGIDWAFQSAVGGYQFVTLVLAGHFQSAVGAPSPFEHVAGITTCPLQTHPRSTSLISSLIPHFNPTVILTLTPALVLCKERCTPLGCRPWRVVAFKCWRCTNRSSQKSFASASPAPG